MNKKDKIINIKLKGKIAEDFAKISKQNKTTVDMTIKRMIVKYLYDEKYKKLKEMLTPYAEEAGMNVDEIIRTLVEETIKELHLNHHHVKPN
jgi:hypothetical protein